MNGELRIGDAERDAVASALHEHFAQGRLDREELDERLSAALAAKTVGDLRQVTRDLPGSPDPVAPVAAAGRSARSRRHWDRPHWDGPPWGGPRWQGPLGAEHYRGGPPWAGHAAGRMAYRGHPRFAPRAGVFLVAFLAVVALTRGWFLVPMFAFIWCAMAFTWIRHGRRRHRLSR
ncbi:DUF1707 SHOCT-like domain-containing protein [Actinoallomurus rhizosphaericola]|uniref:DUF1707 SHOCT-like domain-containing protein n=1 Tax=Actinoallomurus rhizosphaericola TaxID=2952536 RepID=UPI0020916EA4|nr:DUF1707 domain-containing protein [Actinoallomurus rhizosphaericola]MCO5993500.1 DUF1707 domain-containing protein [Actinoallomurus rhizosphaericola]